MSQTQFKWLCEGGTQEVICFPAVYVDFSSVQITFPVSALLWIPGPSALWIFCEIALEPYSIRFWMTNANMDFILFYTIFTQNLKTVILLVFPLRVFIKNCWFCILLRCKLLYTATAWQFCFLHFWFYFILKLYYL